MRKGFVVFTILALLLPVIAGCQSASPGGYHTPTTAATTQATLPGSNIPVVTPEETVSRITPEQAVDIALKDAGLKRDEVKDLDVELDREGGTLHYDVDFEKSGEYDYEIDAVTGNILNKEVPPKVQSQPTKPAQTEKPVQSTQNKQLTRNQARDIALKHAGLSASQVQDLDVELDREGGKTHYDVDFEAGGYEYEYEIDAVSGKILQARKERD